MGKDRPIEMLQNLTKYIIKFGKNVYKKKNIC